MIDVDDDEANEAVVECDRVQFSETSISINCGDRERRDCNLDGATWLGSQSKKHLFSILN